MPEGLEAEIYRRAAESVVGRTVRTVEIDDRQPDAAAIEALLPGRVVDGVRRRGKQLAVDLDDGHALGLHFGMTGRLVVDGESAIERLEYASGRDAPEWDRLRIAFDDGSVLRVNDPRRWAVFSIDPHLDRLGPDVLTLTEAELRASVGRRRAAVKTVLLDQSVVAGFGNMCVDEVLWQAGISPFTPIDRVVDERVGELVGATRRHLPEMLERGGSHTGTIDPSVRAALPPCPRDGAPLRRDTVGGRTTVWCPVHQT